MKKHSLIIALLLGLFASLASIIYYFKLKDQKHKNDTWQPPNLEQNVENDFYNFDEDIEEINKKVDTLKSELHILNTSQINDSKY